jgi:hypothetical protein
LAALPISTPNCRWVFSNDAESFSNPVVSLVIAVTAVFILCITLVWPAVGLLLALPVLLRAAIVVFNVDIALASELKSAADGGVI